MGTVLNPQDLPSLSSDIVKPQDSTTTQPQQASHEEKAKVANRIFWAYILIVLLIILHFAVPMEVQQKFYLDVIYKSLGVISIAYIGFLTMTKQIC